MELKKVKSKTLFSLFLKQLLRLTAGFFIEILLFILILYFGISTNFILPADYSEQYLKENKAIIAKSEPFDKSLIPNACTYGVFDLEGNYLFGDFGDSVVADAKIFIKDTKSVKRRFFLIEKANETIVIHYDISAHFASSTLNKIFPKLELLLLILFVFIFLLIVINSAFSFDRNLKKELKPLFDEIKQIQSRDLNLERKQSKIKEFNDILLSLYNMELALSDSLKKEWETQQKRKSNISALAHDIKTPLTIMKGNSELIMEEDNIAEIYQLADMINHSADKIERYIKLLIDETKNSFTEEGEEEINLSEIVADIIDESEVLCKTKGIELIVSNRGCDEAVILDKELVVRAIINLMKNAIEHTALDKRIMLEFECKDNKFTVKVEDFGKGFTREALKYAKEQLYTDKYERSEEHYGIGMYFANSVAEKYKGDITYYNKSNQTGSVVIFEIMYG